MAGGRRSRSGWGWRGIRRVRGGGLSAPTSRTSMGSDPRPHLLGVMGSDPRPQLLVVTGSDPRPQLLVVTASGPMAEARLGCNWVVSARCTYAETATSGLPRCLVV